MLLCLAITSHAQIYFVSKLCKKKKRYEKQKKTNGLSIRDVHLAGLVKIAQI